MIINSISMKNFQCYYGEHSENTLKFSDGLNLIIGDNGGGKSKIYDAFYWVIHNQVFQSDQRSMINTRIYKENLISDKAKFDCKIGDKVSAEVTLIVSSTNETKYKLERIYTAIKLGEREWKSDIDSTMLISEFSHARWKLVPVEKHSVILNRVIPGHIKPYMWFQGEQVDSLMDLADSTALTKVVNLLSDISDYDDLISIVTTGAAKAETDLKKHKSKISSDETKSNSLNSELDICIENIEKNQREINLCDENIERAKIKVEELISKIDDAEAKAKYKSEKKHLESNYKRIEQELVKMNTNFSKNLFHKHWILKNVEPFFKKFEAKFKKYAVEHSLKENAGKAVEVKLPLNVPQPIHVEQMIDEESCFVCGRSAPKGSDAHDHILNLMNRKPVENVFKNNFFSEFEDLYKNNLSYGVSVKDTDKSILEELENIQQLKKELAETGKQIREIDRQFDTLIEEDKSEDVLGAYKQHSKSQDIYEQKKREFSTKLAKLLDQKIELQGKLDKLVTGEIDVAIETSDIIFKKLKLIVKSTKQNVFEEIIKNLEDSSNDIFKEMTVNNKAIKGRIKFKRLSNGSCIPEIVDSEGFIINSPNDANIILVKLALIMSILTARAKWSLNYSLISDAPTSKMANNYTNGFYKVLSNRFKQSIVMTYDFLDDERRAILKDFNVGNVYKIEPKNLSGNSDNRTELSINISEVEI
ncbi:AAA family ATPase [Rheinheimera sp. UJ51]|uniref:AAA family ATPase n=1 Tax=Rheinheimera sp. UJ51 TaxID=2892446 RepID=UPI001E54C89E|nr:AAA family ATPase [Rheinheimera sp. UJ51]MCC5452867.1 AAA family ATPase [Rheinheimera sp. UJ51]